MKAPFAFAWLFEHARTSAGAPCIGTPAGWTSYADLASRVRALRSAFAARGLARGDQVEIPRP